MLPGHAFVEDELKAHVKARLAPYKAPKRVFLGDNVTMRAPNGKADYKSVTAFAKEAVNS